LQIFVETQKGVNEAVADQTQEVHEGKQNDGLGVGPVNLHEEVDQATVVPVDHYVEDKADGNGDEQEEGREEEVALVKVVELEGVPQLEGRLKDDVDEITLHHSRNNAEQNRLLKHVLLN
jgi:hypothetical protein